MRNGNTMACFSYVDDIRILGFVRTIKDSAVAAQNENDNLTTRAHQNAVLFDGENSEVVQLSGRQKEELVGSLVSGDRIEMTDYICWFGLYLDPCFSFKHHVST